MSENFYLKVIIKTLHSFLLAEMHFNLCRGQKHEKKPLKCNVFALKELLVAFFR